MQVEAICEFLAGVTEPGGDDGNGFGREELAAAALLVECAQVDTGEIGEEERDAICRAVREEFSLDPETAECLVAVAQRRSDELWHDWLFTETVRRSFEPRERLGIIRRLWEVAFADHRIHPHELSLIERISRQLGVEEEARSESRSWLRERMGDPGRGPRE